MATKQSADTEHLPGATLRSTQIPITCPFTQHEISQAWEKCSHTVQEHCDQMVARWKEEIDMFLVFAGLFSAVLTAFNVQSYALLQQDNSSLTAQALVQISAQLNSFAVSGTSINSTAPRFVPPPVYIPIYAIWINALWFSSLICTLAASSVAIMVKQWLHQYSLGLSGNSHEVARLRQYRYGSLLKWHVVGIIAILPILLQIALIFFLTGLVILLWTLSPIVAGIATSLVGFLVIFTVATTLLPAFHPDCFYQSPQALGTFLSLQAMRRLFAPNTRDVFRGWHSREKAEIYTKRVDLDRKLATKAYDITLDENTLKNAVIPCMWDLPPERLSPFLQDMIRISNRWEPIVPCVLHFITLAAKDPGLNRRQVRKLLSDAWWPRMEANSEIGELFVKTLATLVSRRLEPDLAFFRLTCTLSFSALDSGIRIKQEVVEYIVSVLPSPKTGTQFAALIRGRDPNGLPLVYSYLRTIPMLVRYLAHLVVDSPHETLRVQLHIDAMFHTLQTFLMHVAWTEDVSNLSTVLWALRRSHHVAQVVALKTDAQCSPLVPQDIVETYQDVLSNLGSAATSKSFQTYFRRHLDRFSTTNVGGKDPIQLVGMLQEDLDVLAKLFWMVPWQLNVRRHERTASGISSPPSARTPQSAQFPGGFTSPTSSAQASPRPPRSAASKRSTTSPSTGSIRMPVPIPWQAATSEATTAILSGPGEPGQGTAVISMRTALIAGSSKEADSDDPAAAEEAAQAPIRTRLAIKTRPRPTPISTGASPGASPRSGPPSTRTRNLISPVANFVEPMFSEGESQPFLNGGYTSPGAR